MMTERDEAQDSHRRALIELAEWQRMHADLQARLSARIVDLEDQRDEQAEELNAIWAAAGAPEGLSPLQAVERLPGERDNARGAFADLLDSHCHWETAAQAAQAERDALRARAERAEAALAPIIEAYTSADYCGWCQRLLSECTATCAARKARAALAAEGEGTDS